MSRPPYPHRSESTGREQTGDLDRLELPAAGVRRPARAAGAARRHTPRPAAAADGGRCRGGRRRADVHGALGARRARAVRVSTPPRRARRSSARRRRRAASFATRTGSRTTPTRASPPAATSSSSRRSSSAAPSRPGCRWRACRSARSRRRTTRRATTSSSTRCSTSSSRSRAQRPVTIVDGADELRLQGIGHGLEAGDTVALVGPHWRGFVVEEATENAGTGRDHRPPRPRGRHGRSTSTRAAARPARSSGA